MEIPNISDLVSMSPPALVVLFCNVVGWVASTLPFFNNKYIPILLFTVGAISYPLVGPLIADGQVQQKIAHRVIIGACMGGAAIGTNQLFRQMMNKSSNPQ